MAEVIPFPSHGDVFFDVRGRERALRLNWHPENGLVVLSFWRDGECAATFRMRAEDVPQLVGVFVEGLAEWAPSSMSVPRPGPLPAESSATQTGDSIPAVTELPEGQ